MGATEPGKDGYQSILSMLVAAVMGRGAFYYVTIASVVTVLALSANTSFADFPGSAASSPRTSSSPTPSASAGGGWCYSQGIITLSVLAAALLIGFRGITDDLIPLFAIGAFLAFTLSQAGMVQHWRRVGGSEARRSLPINALGAVATGITLVVVAVSKFGEGAWLTVVVIPILMLGFARREPALPERGRADRERRAAGARPSPPSPSPWSPCSRGTS